MSSSIPATPFQERRNASSLILDAQNTPKLQLLYVTCSDGFDTIARLLPEYHRSQGLVLSSSFKLWGLDLFKADEIHLDRLLDDHSFLRRHLLGVLADIAALLESMLQTFAGDPTNIAEAGSRKAHVDLRRLRIALGQNDVSSALVDDEERGGLYEDPSDWVKESLSNLHGLVDCLYDSLFTISIAAKVDCAKSNQIKPLLKEVLPSTISEGMIGDSTESSSRRKNRAHRDRVKNGCLSCRKRHLVCGGERPICANCIKRKHPCEGYASGISFNKDQLSYRIHWPRNESLSEDIQNTSRDDVASYQTSSPSTSHVEELLESRNSLENDRHSGDESADLNPDIQDWQPRYHSLKLGSNERSGSADTVSGTTRSSVSGSEWSRSRPMSASSGYTFRDDTTEATEWDPIPSDYSAENPWRSLHSPVSYRTSIKPVEKGSSRPSGTFLAPPAHDELVFPTTRIHSETPQSWQGSVSSRSDSSRPRHETQSTGKAARELTRSAFERARLASHFEETNDLEQAVQFYQLACDQLIQLSSISLDTGATDASKKTLKVYLGKLTELRETMASRDDR